MAAPSPSISVKLGFPSSVLSIFKSYIPIKQEGLNPRRKPLEGYKLFLLCRNHPMGRTGWILLCWDVPALLQRVRTGLGQAGSPRPSLT